MYCFLGKAFKKGLFCVCIGIFSIGAATPLLSAKAAMQSQSFGIQGDAVSIGGVESEGSTNFRLAETVGEIAAGDSISASVQVFAGYRSLARALAVAIPTPTPTPATAAGGALPGGAAFNATIEVVSVGDAFALITWTGTRENIATLFYGLSGDALDAQLESGTYALAHTLALRELIPGMRYFFKIRSRDRSGADLVDQARQRTPWPDGRDAYYAQPHPLY